MKVVFTGDAAKELEEIVFGIARFSPNAVTGFQNRLQVVIRQIGEWPRAARIVSGRSETRKVALQQYPYSVFYRIVDDTAQILHIRHGARLGPPLDPLQPRRRAAAFLGDRRFTFVQTTPS